ncbi:ArsR/SmtB family transcription factor [Saccharothrix lopnurensis]|uniref:ArsR/SmtB family transcription factor n=1 Tax=Saccharothrix lopnurensis TaxID=1670621 RepID=A0ABW1P833_9PSEU
MVEFPGDLRVGGAPLVSRPIRCARVGGPLPFGEARSAADVFEALSDPVRVRLLWLLEGEPGAGPSGLASRMGVAEDLVVGHLRVLLDAGLVTSGVEGRYEVVAERVAVVRALLGGT